MIYPDLLVNAKNWDRLIKSWKNERLPHAILFHGPLGSGKEGHALELAALLNCTAIENETSCGCCSSCRKTKSFQHESVKLVLPLPRGKIKSSHDPITKAFINPVLKEYLEMLKLKETNPYHTIQLTGANTILINSIRDLKYDASLSTVNNYWRVVLIFQAEKLCVPSPEAAHGLLKILEEPPDKTIFILVSSKPKAILDTIHSRCQSIFFPPISTEKLQENLSKSGLDAVQTMIVARISRGNIRLAHELNQSAADLMEKLYLILNACFSNDPIVWNKCIEITSRLKTNNIHQLEQLFSCLILFYRDLLYYSSTGVDDEIIFRNNLGKIDILTKTYKQADWHACIQNIENTQNYISRNGNLSLQLICMFIEINKSIQGDSYEPFKLNDWTPV